MVSQPRIAAGVAAIGAEEFQLNHDDGVKFSATFGGGFGLTRNFTGFAAAEKEIEDARVWAGIHTRTTRVGHQIAELTVQRVMRPLNSASKGQ